ncbi:MAG TPA: hypothetical protein VGC61_02960 [Pyrinomonadaceae bacterium]|jgi:hypothetical protein
MRSLLVFMVIALYAGSEWALAVPFAQTQNSAQEKAAGLRAQLLEVETKQADLQARLQRLEEDLKPENIESRLAGVGSLHPEDLREQLRKQLEIDRNGVQKQLDLLTTSHTRLETAIAQADAEAYRQSAASEKGPSINTVTGSESPAITATTPTRPRRARKKKTKKSKRAVRHHALR